MARRRSELVEIVGKVPLFADLTRRQLQEIAKACFEARYTAGDVMFKQLDKGQQMLVIVAGTARVERDGRKIAAVGPGDAVGEMSLIDGLPRSASVIADSDVEGIALYRTSFRKLLDETPTLCGRLLLTQTARIRELDSNAATIG
jgi:CRP-like cAMP-binding protein